MSAGSDMSKTTAVLTQLVYLFSCHGNYCDQICIAFTATSFQECREPFWPTQKKKKIKKEQRMNCFMIFVSMVGNILLMSVKSSLRLIDQILVDKATRVISHINETLMNTHSTVSNCNNVHIKVLFKGCVCTIVYRAFPNLSTCFTFTCKI